MFDKLFNFYPNLKLFLEQHPKLGFIPTWDFSGCLARAVSQNAEISSKDETLMATLLQTNTESRILKTFYFVTESLLQTKPEPDMGCQFAKKFS